MASPLYALEHLSAHLHAARDWNRLFLLIDAGEHRVRQAKFFESFDRPGTDLEQHALPAAIEVNDWERFSCYTLMAANLRGLAEELADESILRALVRQGQSRLAAGLAGQLADPLRRTWARAVLASCSEGEARADLIRDVRTELDHLSGPLTGDRLSCLQDMARHLGPDLDDLWQSRLSGWVPGPKEQQEIRWMLAEAWAAQNRLLDSRCRETLAGIDSGILIERLPALWLRYGPDDPTAIRELAAELGDPDGKLFWSIAVPVLGRLASAADDSIWAERAWERQVAPGPPIPWSSSLIEQGRPLFGLFSLAAADRLAGELSDPVLRAALRVVRLEQRSEPQRARDAFDAVEALAEPAIKLSWALRTALAWPEEDAQEKCRLASILTDHLHRRRYAAEATDLARFLDLVAATDHHFLRAQTDNVVWAPGMGVDSLLALAESAKRPDVLAGLIERGESYAAVVGKTEAEGFELRTRLLIRAACRLCGLRGAWDEGVVKKLLPEEEDELREAAARELAALGKTDEAWEVTEKIRSSRRKLIVQLSIAPGRASFDPENLYGAVASVDAVEDERLALEMLAEPPLDPEALIERYLRRMRSRERQVQALIDLAHRAQALEELHREGQRDPMAPLQLVRGSLTAVGSDEHLLGLTLELVELAAPLQKVRALAEVHEAIEVVLLRLNVPWESRREAFETLLARLGPILLERPMRDREFMARCGAVAGLVNLIVDLPDKAEESEAREDLREHWHEVFPVILAAAGRLNGLVAAHLAHPIRARLWGHWLPEISRLVGWERSWRILERLEGWLPWRERLRTRWNGLEYERFVTPWSWLNDEQKKILRLCLDDPRELSERIAGSVGERGLVFRVAVADPERSPEVLLRFKEPERSRIALCLIRDGWVCPKKYPSVRDALLAGIDDAVLRLEAESRQEGEGWLGALAERVARHGLAPSNPASWSLLRRLRDEAQPEAVPLLADAVLDSLPQGRERGEGAFRVWLNGFLASRDDKESGETPARVEKVREALQKALRLDPTSREGKTPRQPELSSLSEDDERGRLPDIYRRWTITQFQRQQRSWWSFFKKQETDGAIGMLGVLLTTSFFCSLVDIALWRPPEPVRTSGFPWWLIALILTYLTNIQICKNVLKSNVPYRRRDWSIATALSFGNPFLGFYAFLAATLQESGHESLTGPLLLGKIRNSCRTRFPSVTRLMGWLFREWGGTFYLLSNMLFLNIFFYSKVVENHWLAATLSVILHTVIVVVLALHWRSETKKSNTLKPTLSFILIILSMAPFTPSIVTLIYVNAFRQGKQKKNRSAAQFLMETRRSSLRLPRGLELRDTWHRTRPVGLKNRIFRYFEAGGPWWHFGQVHEVKKTERLLRWLHTLKSVALVFEGAALYWLVAWSSRGVLGWVISGSAVGLCLVSLVLAGIGLLLFLTRPFQRWFREKVSWRFLFQYSAHRCLITAPLAFLTGLRLGFALHRDNSGMFWECVVAISLARVVIVLPRVFRSMFKPSHLSDGVGIYFLFIAITVLGILTVNEHVWTGAVLWLFGLCTIALPLAVTLFVLRELLDALLRPFRPRDILDPAWSRPLRRTLFFLMITAVLPLGGLAVPAWIWIRYRYWPQFEREWQEHVSRSKRVELQISGATLQGQTGFQAVI